MPAVHLTIGWLPLCFQIDSKFTEQLILVIINTNAVKKTESIFSFPLSAVLTINTTITWNTMWFTSQYYDFKSSHSLLDMRALNVTDP